MSNDAMNDSDDNTHGSEDMKHAANPSSASSEELELLRKVRLALGSMLFMLECARDDLVAMGERMDRLRAVSEQCRMALEDKKKKGEQESSSSGVPADPH